MKPIKGHIVHVSEVLATGILEYIKRLVIDIPEYKHSVIYRVRDLGYNENSIKTIFPKETKLIQWKNIDRPLSIIQDTRAGIELYRLLKVIKPDIIHLHSSKAGFIGRIVAPFVVPRKAIIYTPNGAPFERTDISLFKLKLFQFCEQFADKIAGQVVCVSTSEATAYQNIGIKSICINNGVSIPTVIQKQKDVYKIVIVTSARITAQKNPITFNKIATYFEDDPTIEFIWIGNGNLRRTLTASNITITGWIDQNEVIPILEKAHIYLTTALWEGLPFSALEAMARGLPILGNICVGNIDLIKHKENGFLFTTTDEAIASILELRNESSLLSKMGAASKKRCQRYFSRSTMIDQYRELYDSILMKNNQF